MTSQLFISNFEFAAYPYAIQLAPTDVDAVRRALTGDALEAAKLRQQSAMNSWEREAWERAEDRYENAILADHDERYNF